MWQAFYKDATDCAPVTLKFTLGFAKDYTFAGWQGCFYLLRLNHQHTGDAYKINETEL